MVLNGDILLSPQTLQSKIWQIFGHKSQILWFKYFQIKKNGLEEVPYSILSRTINFVSYYALKFSQCKAMEMANDMLSLKVHYKRRNETLDIKSSSNN